jgi:hypothetical protein
MSQPASPDSPESWAVRLGSRHRLPLHRRTGYLVRHVPGRGDRPAALPGLRTAAGELAPPPPRAGRLPGITRHRLRALFETLPATDITLLYRASSQADLVLTDELNTIARQRHATVHYLTGHRRRGDADPLSAASLLRLLGNLGEHDIYLCGPPGMTASVRRALHELGVGDADIHEEMFAF